MAFYKIRCKLTYHQIRIALFQLFIAAVRTGIYNNVVVFMAPPIMPILFDTLISDYNTKYDNYKNRIGSKGDYLTARTALMNALDTLAEYVNGVANNNPDTIILAGYTPTTGVNNNVPAPLEAQNVVITRGTPGTLITDCDPVANAENYGVILVADNPLPDTVTMSGTGQIVLLDDGMGTMPGGAGTAAAPEIKAVIDLTKTRKKTFINLQIGTTYYVYYWSMNAGGVSPLSEVVSKKVLEG